MKQFLSAAFLLSCGLAPAQVGSFGGPGVLSRGIGNIGQRSGQDVDLRIYGNASGIYDTGLTPLIIRDGKLVQPEGLAGVEVGLGAYGRHTFRRSSLGLDYGGNFRRYTENTGFDGSNQRLALEYAHLVSPRLMLATTTLAGSQTFGTALASLGAMDLDGSSLLFDNRTTYAQTGLAASYAITRRTAFTASGSGYLVSRQSSALVGVKGYTLNGTLTHQVGRESYIAGTYGHIHYDFPRAFGESDINIYTGSWSTQLGRWWDLSLSAGLMMAQVQGVESTALDPEIAALLGVGSVQTIFYRETQLPLVSASLTRRFRRAAWSAVVDRSITPGNGVYLTSRQETIGTNFAYTGFRRWSLNVSLMTLKINSIGQTLQPFRQIWGGGNITYNLGKGFNLTAGYGRRHQDIQSNAFRQDSSRTTIGIAYSPSSIPISFR